MSHTDSLTPRRGFLGGVAGGAAALLVARVSSASAEVRSLTAPPSDAWISKIKGKYRQVFADELGSKDFRVAGDKNGTYWGGVPGWGPTLNTLITPVLRGEKSAASIAGDIKKYCEQLLTTLQPPVLS